jgi:catechol 2,3-dioxygenase-like lactoylglutathione lyase family enzyme
MADTPQPPKLLTAIRPSFIVRDLQASIAHYRDRLGFQLDFQGPDEGPFWAGVSRDGVGIMLKAVAPDVAPQPNRSRHEWAPPDAIIHSPDPDALFRELTGRGASVVKPLSFIDEGLWGFSVADADGYVLAFYQLRDK